MALNCYNKAFICEIKGSSIDENSYVEVTKTILKSSVLGMITGIKKFSQRTIYIIDDGTGSLDCVLWHSQSDDVETIKRIKEDLENALVSSDTKSTCHLLLNKIDKAEEIYYNHGDTICCLGNVKLVKGRLLLDIQHHYKVNDVNAETLWILDVLARQKNN